VGSEIAPRAAARFAARFHLGAACPVADGVRLVVLFVHGLSSKGGNDASG
jgi:hypothetical protein